MTFACAFPFTARRIARFGPLAILLCGVAGAAQAHIFCVSTAAELQAALTAASDGGAYNAEDNDIDVVAGSYPTGAATANGAFFFHSTGAHHLYLFGGYATGCHDRSNDASSTVLDGRHATPVVALRGTNADIVVSHLTVRNGESDQPGAGLQVNYLVAPHALVDITDVIVRDNHSSSAAGGIYAAAGGSLYLFTNLIVGNSADGQYGAGFITGDGGVNEWFNNTVTRNTSAATSNPVGGLYCGGTTDCDIWNSIFWNNNGAGLFLGGSGALLHRNDYGTLAGHVPADAANNLSVAPQFVAPNKGDFHLAGNSPLLGFGTPLGALIDVEGHRYPTTGRSDLGAYAETIFMDGYDGP